MVKVFNVAVSSNRLPIGKENLAVTLESLFKTQHSKGYFTEPGKVIYLQMQVSNYEASAGALNVSLVYGVRPEIATILVAKCA